MKPTYIPMVSNYMLPCYTGYLIFVVAFHAPISLGAMAPPSLPEACPLGFSRQQPDGQCFGELK